MKYARRTSVLRAFLLVRKYTKKYYLKYVVL